MIRRALGLASRCLAVGREMRRNDAQRNRGARHQLMPMHLCSAPNKLADRLTQPEIALLRGVGPYYYWLSFSSDFYC